MKLSFPQGILIGKADVVDEVDITIEEYRDSISVFLKVGGSTIVWLSGLKKEVEVRRV